MPGYGFSVAPRSLNFQWNERVCFVSLIAPLTLRQLCFLGLPTTVSSSPVNGDLLLIVITPSYPDGYWKNSLLSDGPKCQLTSGVRVRRYARAAIASTPSRTTAIMLPLLPTITPNSGCRSALEVAKLRVAHKPCAAARLAPTDRLE